MPVIDPAQKRHCQRCSRWQLVRSSSETYGWASTAHVWHDRTIAISKFLCCADGCAIARYPWPERFSRYIIIELKATVLKGPWDHPAEAGQPFPVDSGLASYFRMRLQAPNRVLAFEKPLSCQILLFGLPEPLRRSGGEPTKTIV